MAKKMKSTFLTMTVTLLVVGAIASTALAMVYKVTKGPIEKSEKEKQEKAIKQVVPEFDELENFKISAGEGEGEDSLVCFSAKKGGEVVATAIKTYTDKGFSGRFTVMVGFLPDGTIYNSVILSHIETPGLGDKMELKKSDWSTQFKDLHPEKNKIEVDKDGGEISSITAATISSRAYCDAINRAYRAFSENIMNN